MNKKILVGLVILAIATSGIWSQEKGDLILAIEPGIGLGIPAVPLGENYLGTLPSIDFALTGNVHYHFTDSFSVNVGVGVAGTYAKFLALGEGGSFLSGGQKTPDVELGDFFGLYLPIPVGVRFTFPTFSIGAGVTENIPLFASGEYSSKAPNGHPVQGIGFTDTFKGLPYLGWYVDVGFGGVLTFQLSGDFANIAELEHVKFPKAEFGKFQFVTISLILRFNSTLAKL